jgi:hypothetical protein
MGFFGKLKQNIHHGGVEVKMQAPASIKMSDAVLPVNITITATDQPAQIKSVKAEIQAVSQNMGFSQPNGATSPTNNVGTPQTVAQEANMQAFTLNPGQSQTVQLNITMNAGAAAQQAGVGAQIAHAIGSLQTLAETLNSNSYTYTLIASADVEGIAFDPSDSQNLQILKPGQFGTAINIKL